MSRSRASSRLRIWLRKRLAVMTITPSLVMRLPASRASRARTASVSEGDRRASNLSCTAVETLLTFCPPGPEARRNTSSSSAGSMAMVSVTCSIWFCESMRRGIAVSWYQTALMVTTGIKKAR